jgi:hypothetical protein
MVEPGMLLPYVTQSTPTPMSMGIQWIEYPAFSNLSAQRGQIRPEDRLGINTVHLTQALYAIPVV